MRTVTFVSHYYQVEMNIHLTNVKYKLLMHNKSLPPLQLYYLDSDRVSYGFHPQIFSIGQIKKLQKALYGTEHWDNII